MEGRFGAVYAASYAADQVLPQLGGRTVREFMGLLIRAMRQDLRDNADEFQHLTALVPAGGTPVTPLRVLDIVVWMSSLV